MTPIYFNYYTSHLTIEHQRYKILSRYLLLHLLLYPVPLAHLGGDFGPNDGVLVELLVVGGLHSVQVYLFDFPLN